MCGPHDNTNVTHMALGDPQFDMPDIEDIQVKHNKIYYGVQGQVNGYTFRPFFLL